jgi:uncharacterized membrane protein YhaH (DUF805 family)
MNFLRLFSFQGRASRGTYALAGTIGVLLKHNLDRFVAYEFFHRRWTVANYLTPLWPTPAKHLNLTGDDKKFLLTIAMLSLPFIWVGIAMTVKRLRDAGADTRYALLFFAPLANVLFFFALCLLPSREEQISGEWRFTGFLERWLPTSKWGSAALAAVASATLGTVLSLWSVEFLGVYGYTLFLFIPFFMGYLAAWIYTYKEPRSLRQCASVALASVLLSGLVMVGIAFEGMICILMAAPIACFLAICGASLGYKTQESRYLRAEPKAMFSLLLVIPLLAGAELHTPLGTPQFKVHTSIEISASPSLVWRRIVAFPPIAEPLRWPFRLGISYPMEARLKGSGLTADRECVFSAGSFREPILAWENEKHFAFGVSAEPLLMKEWSPYRNIHVRHLEDHDFKPQRADFYLTPLANGNTRLDGWTTYENRMWPGTYWRLWTDAIIHEIHGRVFRQVKRLAEEDAAQAKLSAGR